MPTESELLEAKRAYFWDLMKYRPDPRDVHGHYPASKQATGKEDVNKEETADV